MFSVCVCVWVSCVCVQVEALRRADHPSKEFLPTVPDQETEETQPYAPKAGATRKKKNAMKTFGE
jgi:hypothetical protein